jgi:hypothetical protein
VKKSKCAGLAQEIGFSAPNLCSLRWLVEQYVTPDSKIYCEKLRRFSLGNWFFCTKFVQLVLAVEGKLLLFTSKKECNKLDLTAARYFDWSIL